ncbi:class I SAM-dependent methyltransferase [Tsukamurella tyrosinosolvens]|uniref:class I SAM-dependent methyltransferase n=2 Tax=Tsukamurella tyrosinosolvens TaxID=57704 RepID=UPI000799000F|nr:class I SAM-dependent methyltransferase [Tsukamurella tyrosinosolvens]KXP07699.1 phosphatidylethanolamine N-methyltransferase [Tsukamurella tyrosinosolvens]KZL98903.1 phosphatidylethanolamine N-methyltransferase [Tsukamurella tyrosinosolvens]MCA4995217.1 class I SAM-dependent methyltransferase [Tsukamurella tyrosinosolvens]MEC4612170.1 class I SAM-dependent methyltransferase [Tsukamurella tyrosinosolvens]QRY85089.1 class I SAM-dependent methyltransferase [Tsukamurella tyrosinosolvens]
MRYSWSMGDSFFVKMWPRLVRNEPPLVTELRRRNLAGLSGRVLEVGAGTGTNFALYPPEVTAVVALEPEDALRAEASAVADARVEVRPERLDEYVADEPFDAVVFSLVLCSLPDPEGAVRQVRGVLRPDGELRFLEHVAARGGMLEGLQKAADATVWPRLFGNCHAHRDAVGLISGAGFAVTTVEDRMLAPAWVPIPTSPLVLGRAHA